jgi:hypothetical protein
MRTSVIASFRRSTHANFGKGCLREVEDEIVFRLQTGKA